MKPPAILAILLLTLCSSREEKAAVATNVSADAVFHVDDGTADGSVQYDRRPQILTMVKPRYPMDAIPGRVEGAVMVEILIDDQGAVTQARVVSSLLPALDAAAVESIRRWRFVPAVRHGIPVEALARVPVGFRTQ